MFQVNNKDTRTMPIFIPPFRVYRNCCRSGVFIVNFEHISHLLVFLLLTLNMWMPTGIVGINKYYWEVERI